MEKIFSSNDRLYIHLFLLFFSVTGTQAGLQLVVTLPPFPESKLRLQMCAPQLVYIYCGGGCFTG